MVVKISNSYRPDIDGLRALAITAVVGYHAFPEYFQGGFFGVDIFFIISGYLITGILVRDYFNQRLDLKRFYFRRILRIFPALALVLVASFIFGFFFSLVKIL